MGHSESLLIVMDEKGLQDTRGSRGKGGTECKGKNNNTKAHGPGRLLLGLKVVQIIREYKEHPLPNAKVPVLVPT